MPTNNVIDIGEIVVDTVKVRLCHTPHPDRGHDDKATCTIYEFPELTMVQALVLYDLNERMRAAVTIEENTRAVAAFVAEMRKMVVNGPAEEVWEHLSIAQVGKLFSALHPFAARATNGTTPTPPQPPRRVRRARTRASTSP